MEDFDRRSSTLYILVGRFDEEENFDAEVDMPDEGYVYRIDNPQFAEELKNQDEMEQELEFQDIMGGDREDSEEDESDSEEEQPVAMEIDEDYLNQEQPFDEDDDEEDEDMDEGYEGDYTPPGQLLSMHTLSFGKKQYCHYCKETKGVYTCTIFECKGCGNVPLCFTPCLLQFHLDFVERESEEELESDSDQE